MAAAWMLDRAGFGVEVIERDPHVAGRSQSSALGERSVTFGGKNIGHRYTLFREFTAAMGDNPYEPFGINASPVIDGRVRTFDGSRRARSFGRFARDARPRDIARLAPLATRVARAEEHRFLGSDHFAAVGRRRDHRPLSAWFSERFASTVLRAITVRMNGAEPDEVWLGNFGSNLGMLLDSYDQLTGGVARVAEQFEARYRVRSDTEVTALACDATGAVRGVTMRGPDGEERRSEYDGVVLALPASAAAALVRARHPRLADELAAVRYFPGAVVLAEYDQAVFSPDVRGLAFPAGGPLSNAGAYGVEDRHIVRYTFSGRAARSWLGAGFDPEALLAEAEAQVAAHLPVRAASRLRMVARQWPTAYCAYVPDHGSWRTQLAGRIAAVPGLQLTGDYLRGVSIEACFRAARDCVRAVQADAPAAAVPQPTSVAAAGG
jgi:oxygen-dependent protoporphyrinogen oxidase